MFSMYTSFSFVAPENVLSESVKLSDKIVIFSKDSAPLTIFFPILVIDEGSSRERSPVQ